MFIIAHSELGLPIGINPLMVESVTLSSKTYKNDKGEPEHYTKVKTASGDSLLIMEPMMIVLNAVSKESTRLHGVENLEQEQPEEEGEEDGIIEED